MTVSATTGGGLAKVTIAAPKRRVDVALPEYVPAAELLPGLLRHAGDDLADEGQARGGWVLRRADGSLIDPGRSLGEQGLRDGEVLHLVARLDEWPELDYDDLVDAIATGARRRIRSWSGQATRYTGIAVAAGFLLVLLGLLLASGPGWGPPGAVMLGMVVLLLACGVVVARALGDAAAGAAVAACALPYAVAGGALVLHGDRALVDVGPAQVLLGASALLVTAVVGFLGVADRAELFTAGATVAVLGGVGAVLGLAGHDLVTVSAVLVTVVVALMPAFPLLALRLGRLPMPTLPTTAGDLLSDTPTPPRPAVYGAVVRSDEILTGILLGASLVLLPSQIALVAADRTSATILVALVSLAVLLRARLFPTVRHRVWLLVGGLGGLGALLVGVALRDEVLRLLVVPVLAVAGMSALAAGLRYSRHRPGPYLGRGADLLDVLLVIGVVPVACAVVGLYGFMRGLSG